MTTIDHTSSDTERPAADQQMIKALEAENYQHALAAFGAGADPKIVTKDGHSVLWLAAREKDVATAEKLLRAGALLDRPTAFRDQASFMYPDNFVDSQPENRAMLTLFAAWRASQALGHEPGTPAFDQSLASLRAPGSALDTFLQSVNVGGYENKGYNAVVGFSPVPATAVANDNVAAIAFHASEGHLHHAMSRKQILESCDMNDREDQVKSHRIRPAPSTYVEASVVTYYDDEQYNDYVRGTLFFSKNGSNLDAFVADRPALIVTAALDDAIAEGRHDAARAAIKAGADLYRLCDGGRWTAMFAAVDANDPVAVEMMIGHNVPIDSVDFFNRTPLHNAARGSTEFDRPADTDERAQNVIQALIEHGADINALDHAGQSPLHLAVMYDRSPAVATLLQAGADTTHRDNHGKTPEEHIRNPERDEAAKVFASWRAQQMLAAGDAPAAPAP